MPNHLVHHLSNKRLKTKKRSFTVILSKEADTFALVALHPLGDLIFYKSRFSLLPAFHFSGRMLHHITWWSGDTDGQPSKIRPPCFELLKSIDFKIGESMLWIMFPSLIRLITFLVKVRSSKQINAKVRSFCWLEWQSISSQKTGNVCSELYYNFIRLGISSF